jgi:hypothetical protein
MLSVSFSLREPNSNKSTPIICFISFQGKRVKYPTGQKIHPKYWDKESHVVDDSIEGKKRTHMSINSVLYDIRKEILRIESDYRFQSSELTPNLIRERLYAVLHHVINIKPRNNSALKFFNEYVNTVTHIYHRGSYRLINERTKKKYRTLINVLEEYMEHKKLNDLTFDQIDMVFFEQFVIYLQNRKIFKKPNRRDEMNKRTLSTNAISKYIKTLKTLLEVAKEKGINKNLHYKNPRFNITEVVTDKIYLTQKEIDKLYLLDLSKNKKLEQVRDCFLIGCYTALRYSDFSRLQKTNKYSNDKGDFIKVQMYKEKRPVVIPLAYVVEKILDKYNWNLPKISNQKTNDYIKEVCSMAGIDKKSEMEVYEDGEIVIKYVKRYELVSSHTARRTGATLMYQCNVRSLNLMKITGHKTEAAFLRYIRTSEEESAILEMDNPFFKHIPKDENKE